MSCTSEVGNCGIVVWHTDGVLAPSMGPVCIHSPCSGAAEPSNMVTGPQNTALLYLLSLLQPNSGSLGVGSLNSPGVQRTAVVDGNPRSVCGSTLKN